MVSRVRVLIATKFEYFLDQLFRPLGAMYCTANCETGNAFPVHLLKPNFLRPVCTCVVLSRLKKKLLSGQQIETFLQDIHQISCYLLPGNIGKAYSKENQG